MTADVQSPEARRLRLACELHEAGRAIALERYQRELGVSRSEAHELLRKDLREQPLPDFSPQPSYLSAEAVASASSVAIAPGLELPVATRASLIVFKLVSESLARPQDASDLLELIRASSDAELATARALCSLSVARGFNRGRDLSASLDEFVRLAAEA